MPLHQGQQSLLGILACQQDLVSPDQLRAAASSWHTDPSRDLGDILVESGELTPEDRDRLEKMIHDQSEAAGPDSVAALINPASLESLRDLIESMPAFAALNELSLSAPRSLDWMDSESLNVSAGLYSVDDSTAATKGRFKHIRPLAKGGLGEVSVALDLELRREVAFKEIQAPFADRQDCRTRFEVEAEITGRLEHPGIVPVYGRGTDEKGRPYYAMRLIKGESLLKAINRFHQLPPVGRQRRMELRRLVGKLIDACEAVDYAHSRGIVHRDLKPTNIMLGKFGETLVVDWGLAKAQGRPEEHQDSKDRSLQPEAARDSLPTRFGTIVGTPGYLSVEQANGEVQQVGPASDVYGLGATLYHLLVGHAPFQGDEPAQRLAANQRGEFIDARTLNPKVPRGLSAICRRAMALKPEDRYGTPSLLADDLERFLADEPVVACPDGWSDRIRRWVRRRPALVATALVAILIGVALSASFGVVVWSQNRDLEIKNRLLNKQAQQIQEQSNQLLIAQEAVADGRFQVQTLHTVVDKVRAGLAKETIGTEFAFEVSAALRESELAQMAVGDWETLLDQPSKELPELLHLRLKLLREKQDFYEAALAAVELYEQNGVVPHQMFDAACVLATTVELEVEPIEEHLDDKLVDSDVRLEWSFILLRRAVDLGYRDPITLSTHPDLACLRDRPQFRELLANVQK